MQGDEAMDGWTRICSLDELPKRGARVVLRAYRPPLAVIRTGDDALFAVHDRCPHRGGPLSQGLVHGDRVTCPLHGWTIDLASGSAVAPDVGGVKSFPVRLVDGDVYLRSGDIASDHDCDESDGRALQRAPNG
jgi:nitrite reductase (NADH) small subunit